MKKTIKTVLLIMSILCMTAAPALAAGIFLAEESTESSESPVKNLIISLIIGAVIAGIVVGVMASKHKSVRWKNNASDYEKEGSFDLQVSEDIYSHTTTDKRRKSK